MSSMPFAIELECNVNSQTLIWIPEVDARGTLADPLFAKAAYENQANFFRYRANELTDPASRADLLEQAVFRASKAKPSEPIEDRERYLFRTYAALVDHELSVSVKTLNAEPVSLEYRGSTDLGRKAEAEITNQIYRREILEAMPEEARILWERRIVGYTFEQMADETHESADTLNARARRGAKEAFRRLFGQYHR
jgi:DNA-directed RNA polymerase specialized sigma24 family protein